MFEWLWLIPVLPFAGFLILALLGKRLAHSIVSVVGVGSVGISALLTLIIGIRFVFGSEYDLIFTQTLWTWFDVYGFSPAIAFQLDALSLVFIFVITFVGFLIHFYSTEYMGKDEGYSRFFAYMNLFVGSMLTLVLADNLLLLYLGWEGVGLCSYLLIGFWYKDPYNGYAARKAFVVTRVGDTAMAIGLFLLVSHFGTLHIQTVLEQSGQQWAVGSTLAVATAALLLGGAVGKSAQLPLQTWLPDAMAGPTPVSALIHAATMVTAGVYLIARMNALFIIAPLVLTAVAIIGVLTLLLSGFTALMQTDIKRVLAYSTISQIGYMFLALGVGAWSAGIFHFMTHAFFKALLFLGAGAVIHGLHDKQDMRQMGGLRTQLPLTFWTFLIGSASLAALPLVTAGFYSKDMILWYAWAGGRGSFWLWSGALLGAFLTGLYTFRMVFMTFFGEPASTVTHLPTFRMHVPLVVLAVFSLGAGFIELPHTLGHLPLFSGFMSYMLPAIEALSSKIRMEIYFQVYAAFAGLLGIYLAYLLFLKRIRSADMIAGWSISKLLGPFWFSGWGFDWLYDRVFVRPLVWLSEINKNDFFDKMYEGIAHVNLLIHRNVSRTQSGQLRWYAAGLAAGAAITLTLAVLL